MWMLLLTLTALAQDPATPTSDAWTIEPTALTRFSDTSDALAELLAGEKVEVLVHKGDQARVRRGTDFGWVAADKLTDQAPAPTP